MNIKFCKNKVFLAFTLALILICLSFTVYNLSACDFSNQNFAIAETINSPERACFEDGILYFSIPQNASCLIYVGPIFIKETTSNEFNLSPYLLDGNYTLALKTKLNDEFSNFTYLQIKFSQKPDMPKNLSLSLKNLLSWSKVKNATQYQVVVTFEGVESVFSPTDNFLLLSQDYDNISVVAVNDKQKSEPAILTKLNNEE